MLVADLKVTVIKGDKVSGLNTQQLWQVLTITANSNCSSTDSQNVFMWEPHWWDARQGRYIIRNNASGPTFTL